MENCNDLNELMKELKASPIHSMSLGSKELFHSDFWAWIMENAKGRKEFLKLFFDDVEFPDPEIKREYHNMDIVIYPDKNAQDKGFYVIENKIKSYPNKEQLERYAEKEDGSFKQGVITGIMNPEFDDLTDWKYISYDEIGARLKDIAKYEETDFYKELLTTYANYISLLSRIIKEFDASIENCLPIWNDQLKTLNELRIGDIGQKYAASRFLKQCEGDPRFKEIKNEIESGPEGYKLATWYSFSNGSYTIDFRICHDPKTPDKADMGIQIQGKEYRLYAEVVGKDNYDKTAAVNHCDILFKELCNNNWLNENFDKKEKTRYEHNGLIGTSQTKMYGRYTGRSGEIQDKWYSFVYQYFDITKDTSSYEFIINSVIADLRNALRIMDNSDK